MPHYNLIAETLNTGVWAPVDVHTDEGALLFCTLARMHARGLLELREPHSYDSGTTARLVQAPVPAPAYPAFDELTTFPNSTCSLVRADQFLPGIGPADSYVVRYRLSASTPLNGCRTFDSLREAIAFQARHEVQI